MEVHCGAPVRTAPMRSGAHVRTSAICGTGTRLQRVGRSGWPPAPDLTHAEQQAASMNLCRGKTIKCVWAPTTRQGPTPKKRVRQRPTLPHPPECSTIGAVGLSYRVRKGNRAFPQRYDHRNNHTKTVPHHTHRVRGSDTIQTIQPHHQHHPQKGHCRQPQGVRSINRLVDANTQANTPTNSQCFMRILIKSSTN